MRGEHEKGEEGEMKRVLGLVMAAVLTVSSLGGFGGLKVKAAETNVSRETALEIGNDDFKTGSLTKEESKVGRWYKFTNYSNQCSYAEVTMSHTDGDVWPNFAFYYKNGKATGHSGFFTGDGETVVIGMEAHETIYLHIHSDGWRSGFSTYVKITPEEPNDFKTAKKTYKSGKNIYGTIEHDKDVDFFKIKPKKTGTMTIKITNNDLGNDLSHLKYTVFNKSKRAKANGSIDYGKTKKIKLKVKKNQPIYIKLEGYFFCARRENGTYVIGTKIK